MTRWESDPFSRGAFSCVAVGGSSDAYDKLGAPVNNHLFFAVSLQHRANRTRQPMLALRSLRQLLYLRAYVRVPLHPCSGAPASPFHRPFMFGPPCYPDPWNPRPFVRFARLLHDFGRQGEATSRTHPSSMSGAFLSGHRAAAQIVATHGRHRNALVQVMLPSLAKA